jgi:hypothetical protein
MEVKSKMNWQEIALDYKKEIEALHKEIVEATFVMDQRGPRSFDKALGILENSLEISQENFRLIKSLEPAIIQKKGKKVIPSVKEEKHDVDDCFSNLL